MNIFMLIDPRQIMIEIHRPSVQKGAAWLDEYEPRWVSKIVPEELNLASTDLCICGQMFGAYAHRPHFVFDAQNFGFQHRVEAYDRFNQCHSWPEDVGIDRLSYEALDILWLDEIFWRKHPHWLVDAIGF